VSSQVELSQPEGSPLLGYASRLLSRTEVAQDTVAFRFERPRNFLFRAGQSIDLTLLGTRADGSDCLTHTFSIASSPFVEEILVATRIRDSAFKQALSILPLGAHVNLSGPMGSFTLHHNASKPAVFLAGGIGVAPFLSMLFSAAVDKARHNIVLFYANRYLEDAAFMDALWDLESSNTNFRFVPTFTRVDGTSRGWQGEIGHIRPKMLSKHVSNLRGPIFYIAGPPAMVAGMRRMLVDAGVDEDDIRTEEFAGY
jgi:ferredoxin-NADP reductase